MNNVYFDNAATTKLSPMVFADMAPFFLESYANPGSAHDFGQQAASAVEDARRYVADVFGGTKHSVFFTSGGTESDNWAINSALLTTGKNKVITSAIEHKAILSTLKHLNEHFDVDFVLLPVDGNGRVNPDDLRKAICKKTAIVSVMSANNEVGTIQPTEELYRICREKGVLFHTDAVQAFGKIPVSAKSADLISVSAHKVHGPKGSGVLWANPDVKMSPLICGGAQEGGLRGGTTPVPLVVGTGSAFSLAFNTRATFASKVASLCAEFENGLLNIPNTTINCQKASRVPGITSVCFRGVESHAVVSELSRRFGICCSSGSACSEKSTAPSYVLRACGLSVADSHATVRFSLGTLNTAEEVLFVLRSVETVIQELRRISF